MTVTLTVYGLRFPDGELTEAMFPGGNLDQLIAKWLSQAKTKVEAQGGIAAANQNAAAAAWVYHIAYSHVANRLRLAPASVSDGFVERTIASDQRAHFAGLAATKLAEYNGYNETDEIDVAPRYSMGVSTRATW